MSDRAEVTSVSAIGDFRAALLVYIAKVRPLLDDAADEVLRTRDWLAGTQRMHWENQVRVRTRALTDAQQALFSAELARLRAPSSAELLAVQKARRALAEAEEKLRTVKRMAATFEKETAPRLKQMESLRGLVTGDLQDGVHFLGRMLDALERYAQPAATRPATESLAEPVQGEAP